VKNDDTIESTNARGIEENFLGDYCPEEIDDTYESSGLKCNYYTASSQRYLKINTLIQYFDSYIRLI